MTELPELPPTPRTRLFNEEALDRGLEIFEREALWLLISLHHYGWRAHADMVELLISEAGPEIEGDHHREHRAMAAIEELFLLLDQLWRTVSGIKAQRDGQGFLAGYSRYGRDITREFTELAAFTEDDWRGILGIPPDDQMQEALRERGMEDDLELFRASAADVAGTAVRNMTEIGDLFVRPAAVAGEQPRSFRDINNAYRHGSRILYEDCSPEEIPWRAANPAQADGMLIAAGEVVEAARADTVNVLLEGPDEGGHARFASVSRDAETHNSLLEGSRTLSILLWRLVTSFLVAELQGGHVLSATVPFTWHELNARYRHDERR